MRSLFLAASSLSGSVSGVGCGGGKQANNYRGDAHGVLSVSNNDIDDALHSEILSAHEPWQRCVGLRFCNGKKNDVNARKSINSIPIGLTSVSSTG